MLTFPSAYTSALSSPFKENWLVRLYKSDGTYIGISFSSVTMDDSIGYTGAILNQPTVRESVNFTSGRAQNGNMTLEVANYAISSSTLLKTLYTGNYLNQSVKIYSSLNSNTAFANVTQIFEGRLNNVDLTETENIKLSIVVKRPWDDIELPNTLSDNGVYVPIIYGSYTSNTYQDTSNVNLAPIPFLKTDAEDLFFANHQSTTSHAPHTYDNTARHFPVLLSTGSSSTTKEGVDAVGVDDLIRRVYRIRPEININDAGQFSNTANSIDTDVSTFSQSSLAVNDGTDEDVIKFNLPQISGKITYLALNVKWDISYTDNEQSTSNAVRIQHQVDYGGTLTSGNILNDTDVATGSTETASSSGTADINNSGTSHSNYNLTTAVGNNNDKMPERINISHYVQQDNNSSNLELTSTLKIYDVWFDVVAESDQANEPSATGQEKAQLDKIYVANPGFNASWGGSANKAHEVHRDILYRFLGITSTPTNYNTLESQKSGNVLFYTEVDKLKESKKLLDELAYEGGFVFRFRADGNPVYHFIENSPSVTSGLTLSHQDIVGLVVGHTPLNEIITKWNARFEKNPARNEYKQNASHTSSARSNFYVGSSKENVKEVKLKYLKDNVAHTGGNRNASFLDYYNSIVGNVKQIVKFKLINPTKSYIEVGDVINFNNSNMKIESLSGAWTNLKFIVTSTTRAVGGTVNVEAREI